MRRKIALALVMLLVFLPVTALAGNIAEKDDYSDDQINPSRLSQSAPFTLTGTLSNGSFGGDVDCVTFTADERARYVFELSSDTKVFIPTVGLIKLSGSNDYDTLTKYSANTPADTASVYFDFKKGDTVIVVMTMASLEVPEGKKPLYAECDEGGYSIQYHRILAARHRTERCCDRFGDIHCDGCGACWQRFDQYRAEYRGVAGR